jgi:ribonuclease VapC
MVVDSSALLAILQAEPDGPRVAHAIAASRNRRVSAVSYVETSIVVLARYGEAGADKLGRLLHEAEIEIAPVTPDQARVAADAYRRFGKGRHPAALNLGDCFAYAAAMAYGEPLLFCGDDFARTDVTAG